MTILNVSLNIPNESFDQILHSMSAFQVVLEPPGVNLYRILETASQGKPFQIFGTGSIRDVNPSALMSDGWDTFFLAKWVQAHPGSTLNVVEIDPIAIEKCEGLLKQYGLNIPDVGLWRGDSLDFMETWDMPVDLFVLDSCDGLEHGLAEFKSALNFKPKYIVMDDWDTKVQLAAEYATSANIPFQRIDRYTVFKIPQ